METQIQPDSGHSGMQQTTSVNLDKLTEIRSCSARNKIRDNPENEVGIISMSDNFVRCSLTSETQKLNTVLLQKRRFAVLNRLSIKISLLYLDSLVRHFLSVFVL